MHFYSLFRNFESGMNFMDNNAMHFPSPIPWMLGRSYEHSSLHMPKPKRKIFKRAKSASSASKGGLS